MSKKNRRKKRDAVSIGEAIGNSVDQGLMRSAATMGQQRMEHLLKTDPKNQVTRRKISESATRTGVAAARPTKRNDDDSNQLT